MAVTALLFGRHLAERLPRSGHQEDRVVAEPGLAAPLRDHLAAALALEESRPVAGQRQGDHAHEARIPGSRHALEPAQQLRRAPRLAWAKTRGADAREAAQRVHLRPRVIPERGEA